MSSSLTEANLERKFQGVTNTQDSIQTLSLWLLHHKAHHKRIVCTWMKVLKKAKISQRLVLFYLANDVIQNSKRKGVPFFKESFAEILREATLFVRDEHIRNNVNRVFSIWSERSIYDSDFVSDLQGILANAKVPGSAPMKSIAEFKCEKVIDKLKIVSKIRQEVAAKMLTVNVGKLNATNSEIVQKLKDRMHGQHFSKEFDDSTKNLEELIKALNKEIEERNELIILLEQSGIYYDTQRGEAKIVSNAYKNFSLRVSSVQKKLTEMIPDLGSPIPSPPPDAPSPTNSDIELELPGDKAISAEKEEEQEAEDKIEVVASVPETSAPAASISFASSLTTCIGNPIPTLSNLFPQAKQGKTASWFSSLSTATPVSTTTPPSGVSAPAADSSVSLDSRLSSLFQNIPNLPSGLHDTLLAASTTDSNSQSSVSVYRNTGSMYETTKDDRSGQNTPLQDEGSPSTSSPFFSRLASASKASQSPQDILRGLTNLIATATKDKVQRPGSWHQQQQEISSPYETPSRIDVITSDPMSAEPVTSPLYYTASSSMISSNSSVNSPLSLPGFMSTTMSPSYNPGSTQVQANLSYIPSIVPSAPKTTHYGYEANAGFEEYDPCSVSFKEDDNGSVGGQSNATPPLSESPSSPDELLSGDELEDSMNMSRQSTLITLVSNTLTSTPSINEEKVDNEMPNDLETPVLPTSQAPIWQSKPMQDTKPLKPPTFSKPGNINFQLPDEQHIDNGCSTTTLVEPGFIIEGDAQNSWQPSKIETVQSPRTRNPADYLWLSNDVASFPQEPFQKYYEPEREPYVRGETFHDYRRHSSGPPPMSGWHGQSRPFGNNYHRGGRPPMRKNFNQFSPRGRGRWRRSPLY